MSNISSSFFSSKEQHLDRPIICKVQPALLTESQSALLFGRARSKTHVAIEVTHYGLCFIQEYAVAWCKTRVAVILRSTRL
jgi:hypothetical protein